MGTILEQPVGWHVHPCNVIVPIKKLEYIGQILAHEWLTTRNPQICDGRHGIGYFFNLLKLQVTALVQLLPVETVAALLVTNGSNKKNDRVQAFFSLHLFNQELRFVNL